MLKSLDLVASYCIIDDILKHLGIKTDPRAKLSDSEIITLGLYASFYCGGNHEKAMYQMRKAGEISTTLDKSRLCRRLHLLPFLIRPIFEVISEIWINGVCERTFIIDSTPVPLCDNIRIIRQRITDKPGMRGYQASFRRYFFGVKVQMITTSNGIPIDYMITTGSVHDNKAFKAMELNLPPESTLIGDNAYADEEHKQQLLEDFAILLKTPLRSNSTKKAKEIYSKSLTAARKRIESVFSALKGLFPRKIHATTLKGFLLKIEYFILTFQLHKSTPLLAT
jgi:hypothetical protein